MSTTFDDFQQITTISFKSDVAVMFAVKDLPENSLKSAETSPARTKKAIQAASAAILTYFYGIVPVSD